MSKVKIEHLAQAYKNDPTLKRFFLALSACVEEPAWDYARHLIAHGLVHIERNARIPDRLYNPLIKMCVRENQGGLVEMVCKDLMQHYQEDLEFDTNLLKMLRKGRKFANTSNPQGHFYPAKIPGELHWTDTSFMGSSRTDIKYVMPGKVLKVETKVELLMVGRDEDGFLQQEIISMEGEDIQDILAPGCVVQEGACLELITFEDGTVEFYMEKL
jgi:hypothetical protein